MYAPRGPRARSRSARVAAGARAWYRGAAEHPMDARERELIAINTLDILKAFGLGDLRTFRRSVEMAVRHPARVFARQVIRFDDAVAVRGIHGAARVLVSAYAQDLAVRGAERIPSNGPVLLISNHPGMTDTVCLFAAIDRPDLKILAADRPFLRALRAASRSLLFIPDEPGNRLAALRGAIHHLQAGGALLTFPAGAIEPDPAVLPGAVEALGHWSPSTALFLRFVPEARVVPVVVRGVLARGAQRSPLVRLRRSREDREMLGAMLQIVVRTLFPDAWPVRVRVDFLETFDGRELAARGTDAVEAIRERVAAFLRPRARE